MTTPLCQKFDSCGGCTSQHIDYKIQLENKQKQLQHITKIDAIKVFSDNEYFYRNRMDFIFHKDGLGLRKKGHWDKIIPIEQCVIAEEKINFLIKEINSYFINCDFFDLKKHTGTFRYAVIRCTKDDSSISFVLNSKSTKLATAIEKIKLFAKESTATSILVTYVQPQTDMSISNEYFIVKGKDYLDTNYLGKKLSYASQGFFQNNHIMAEKMQDYVRNLLIKYETKNSMLIDLYGGVGTFGIINADLFKKVIIVESVKESIECAKKNIPKNNLNNVEAIVLDAKQISRLTFKKPFYVITDPPRTGMDQKTISVLNQEKPQSIIYISCNPEQLAKDLPKLRNYEIKTAALFDLFPQTPHSEAIVELCLKTILEKTKEEY